MFESSKLARDFECDLVESWDLVFFLVLDVIYGRLLIRMWELCFFFLSFVFWGDSLLVGVIFVSRIFFIIFFGWWKVKDGYVLGIFRIVFFKLFFLGEDEKLIIFLSIVGNEWCLRIIVGYFSVIDILLWGIFWFGWYDNFRVLILMLV